MTALQEVEHVMQVMEDLLRKCKDEAVVTAAVQSWALLLSIAPPHLVSLLFRRLGV